MLRVVGLGKRYGQRWLFRGIEFEVTSGQRLVVTGDNGSGKSTLLKILAGLLPPTAGGVNLDGDPRLSLGYAALDLAVYPSITTREHFTIAARLRGCEARDDELITKSNLEAVSELPARALSTGQRMRLKLMLAIQANPAILLLDEPGAGFDAAGRKLLESVLSDFPGGVVLATNQQEERRFATHELVLA